MKNYLIYSFLLLVLAVAVFKFGSGSESIEEKPEVANETRKSSTPLRQGKDHFRSLKVFDYPEVILDEKVTKIIDDTQPFNYRSELIWDLQKKPLTKNSEDTLQAFLIDNVDQKDFCVKNDTIEALIRKGTQIRENGDLFIQILMDRSHKPVLREYLLQYMAEYFYKRWEKGSLDEGDSQDRELFVKALWFTADDTEDAIAGTAVQTLLDISRDFTGISSEKVFSKAADILNDNTYSSASRMGAVHALSTSGNKEHYSTLKLTAMDEINSDLLRIAAINSAIKLNNEDTEMKTFLSSLQKSKNRRLQRAAALNIKSLK